uniref:PBPb domain-containing protein n=1 Tax=Strongyloides papillosus TaxID=174720 RepID=A0A0N5BYI7_STREA
MSLRDDMSNYSPHNPDFVFRIGAFSAEPDVFNCFANLPKKPCPKPGAEMEMVQIIMALLKWNWTVIDVVKEYGIDPQFGDPLPNAPMNYTGILGLLQNGIIDMAMPSMKITVSRKQNASVIFSYPFRFFQQIYIIATPTENDYRNFIFATFSTHVWLLIVASLVSVIILEFFILMLEEKNIPLPQKIIDSFTEPISIILRQNVKKHKSIAHFIFQGNLLLMFVVIYVYFQSVMNSRLTAPEKQQLPFTNQKEFLDLLEKGIRFPTYIEDKMPDCSNEENCKRMPQIFKRNPIRIATTFNEIIDQIRKGGIYYADYDVEFIPDVASVWSYKDSLTIIRDPTGIRSYGGFAFHKQNARYRNQFNNALARIMGGINQINLASGYNEKKASSNNVVRPQRMTLSLTKHFEQLFLIFGIGLGISIFIISIEILLDKILLVKRLLVRTFLNK